MTHPNPNPNPNLNPNPNPNPNPRSGAIIAGQFFLYDIFKGAFKVTAADLTQFLDMFSALGSASTTP